MITKSATQELGLARRLFVTVSKWILKVTNKRSWVTFAMLKETTLEQLHYLPILKIYCTAQLIKTICYWSENRRETTVGQSERPAGDPNTVSWPWTEARKQWKGSRWLPRMSRVLKLDVCMKRIQATVESEKTITLLEESLCDLS